MRIIVNERAIGGQIYKARGFIRDLHNIPAREVPKYLR